MWQKEFSIKTDATNEKIWSLWTDVENWKKWDDSVEYSNLDGDFKNGARGFLKTLNGPKASFTLVDCVKNRSFTSRLKLPLCTLDFVHELFRDENNVLKIRHKVKIYGFLTFIFKNVIGKNAASGLQPAVKKLIERANGRY
jgi:hypothetical protein